MNLLDKTPRQIFERFIIPKPEVDQTSLELAKKGLPFDNLGEVLGQGDYGRGRSEGGSAVLTIGENKATKTVLGRAMADGFETARSYQESIKHFQPVSPQTGIIIASNGESVVPIVVQDRVKGRSLGDVSLREIITNENIVTSLKNIFTLARSFFRETGRLDLGGLRVNNPARYLLGLVPFLTDNILVDDSENKAWLVDNTPDASCHRARSFKARVWCELKLAVGTATCNALLWNIEANKRRQKKASSPALAEQI